MADPAVTVITTAFNRAHTVASTIRSVRAQTFGDYEHVIAADDGSPDETTAVVNELAREDPRIRVIEHAHTNQPGGINIGLEHARGEHVAFIDSDDVMMPRYLEVMMAAWERDPELGFAYTDAWNFDHHSKRINRTTFLERYVPEIPGPSAEELLIALIPVNFISEESTVRRVALEDIGGFDETMTHSTDYDVWVRILSKGYRGVRVDGPLLIHRNTPDSLSKNEIALYECNRLIFEKLANELPASDRVKGLARERIVQIDAALKRLSSPTASQRTVAGTRRALGRIKRRALDRRLYFDTPPAPIREAFPDLDSL